MCGSRSRLASSGVPIGICAAENHPVDHETDHWIGIPVEAFVDAEVSPVVGLGSADDMVLGGRGHGRRRRQAVGRRSVPTVPDAAIVGGRRPLPLIKPLATTGVLAVRCWKRYAAFAKLSFDRSRVTNACSHKIRFRLMCDCGEGCLGSPVQNSSFEFDLPILGLGCASVGGCPLSAPPRRPGRREVVCNRLGRNRPGGNCHDGRLGSEGRPDWPWLASVNAAGAALVGIGYV